MFALVYLILLILFLYLLNKKIKHGPVMSEPFDDEPAEPYSIRENPIMNK